ncbi:MFS transporter [soil metagenome]
MSHIGRPPFDEASIHGARHDTVACTATQKRWVLVATIVGSSMAFIDGTIVNVALPSIQQSLRATAADAQWVVESYALLLASLLLVGGSLGDHFGRRRIFVVGVVFFAIASVACAMSQRIDFLIMARALQGIGAALLVPGSLALISASFPEGERGKAIGTWSGFSGITAAVGPVLGGVLVDHYSWIWAFLVNIPFAMVVVYAARHIPESDGGGKQGPLDYVGAVLATIGLGGITFAFIEAPVRHWTSAAVIASMAVGLIATASFLVVQARSRFPMLPLGLFRNRNFAGTNVLTLLLYGALGGGLYYLPLNLIQVQGFSATAAGAALLPFIAIMFLLSRWAGQLVDKVGPKLPLVAGPLIAGAGFVLFAVPGVGVGYWGSFLPAVVVLGVGMAITVAPLTTTVMNSVGPDQAGIASGVNNAVSRAASLLALAVFGIVMAVAFDVALMSRLASLGVDSGVRDFYVGQLDRLAGAELPPNVADSLKSSLKAAVGEAFVSGFRWVMSISAGLAVLSAVSAWVWIERVPKVAAEAVNAPPIGG